ncbi:long-chain fatty acid--CoA ligase [Rhodococcus sp. WS3]|uniref:class I adenylate-forming enzyme family protein n=1 Tax=Rhodococcus sp. WS3 TaxID=2486271 RepID=UPI00114220E9|nr:AMP-binding protein [Rhodococcus sp. WS3]ROZ45644.1 long-chain fatty acid--CoA ligase [Rhodococcus sp. WS3]
MNKTFDTTVREHARTNPDGVAVVDPHMSITWRELNESASRVAELLRQKGIGPGSRVGVLTQNCAGYPAIILGVARRRASVANMNWRLPASNVRESGVEIGLEYIFVGAELAASAAEMTPPGADYTVLDRTSLPGADVDFATAEAAVLESEIDDETTIYFTSGTTGAPKAVPLNLDAVTAAYTYGTVHELEATSTMFIVPPTFHAAGAICMGYTLIAGGTVVFADDLSPGGIVETLRNHEVTHVVMVPTLIHSVVHWLRDSPTPLPALKHVAYGASPIALPLLQEAVRVLDCDFCQVYGMSETGGAVTFLASSDHDLSAGGGSKLTSAGRPGKDVEVQARDIVTGEDLPIGESGELWFRAPSMTKGYIGRPDETARVLVDGWLNTRDFGYMDEDGYMFVEGRSDDMIVTGAENVHPGEVEAAIVLMPGVAECAVFGVPDDKWGQIIASAVVVDSDEITEDDIMAHCRQNLAGYKCPKDLRLVPQLPRTATGKVMRGKLAEHVLNSRLREVAAGQL